MKARFFHIWEILTSSYWFVPTVMLTAGAGLALALLRLDAGYLKNRGLADWLYSGGIEGARAVLSTVAASVITVAGVVFSITIATLTQASSQFGPRLLRNFMRDTGNQVVLGTFVSTFVYCLLVLRSIGSGPDSIGVPHASVMAAVLLALASIVVLIYFIHHVSRSLQAPIVVATVAHDLEQALANIYPSDLGHGPRGPRAEEVNPELPEPFRHDLSPVAASKDGYLQVIDQETLMELAVKHDLVLKIAQRPGDYLVAGNPMLYVHPAARCTPELAEELGQLFILGRQRTAEQDIEFAIHQLVEIAVRALSPGTNDPYTAMNCIDRLASALVKIEANDLHGSCRIDAQGRLRIVARVGTFVGFVDAAFNQIRQYGRESVAVTVRLLEAIGATARQMRHELHRRHLLRHAEMIYRQACRCIHEPNDLADIRQRYETAARLLGVARPTVEEAA